MRSTLIALAIVLTLTLNLFAAPPIPVEPPSKPGDGKPWTAQQVEDARKAGHLFKPATELYRASEFSVDVFGAVEIDDTEHLEDHIAGYGFGFNYFITRNFGLGLEARSQLHRSDENWMNRMSVKGIWRVPVNAFNFNGFVGAGFRYQQHDLDQRFYAGLGVGYQFNGNLGVFVDGRIETEDFKSREPLAFRFGVNISL